MLERVGDRLICRNCGVNIAYRGKILRHSCKLRLTCPYLGQPRDGDLLTVGLVCGCKANRKRRQQSFIVHDCAVQGRCLPAYTCSPDAVETFVAGDWAEPCRGCSKRPTAARPATAPAPARE